MDKQTFINMVKDGAIQGQQKYGVLSSMTIAQAILESAWGESKLSQIAKNLFGIKWTGTGEYTTMRTAEYSNGVKYYIDAKFRAYDSYADSILDHAKFLVDNNRYKNLLGVTDYKISCQLIQQDGYATDPSYANLLIQIIEENNLNQYDVINGWIKKDNYWYYYENGSQVKNQWRKDSKDWCYLNGDGTMAVNEWHQDSTTKWLFCGEDGRIVRNKWRKDSKDWCYLGSDGYMVTNQWQKDSHGTCYCGSDGRIVRNTMIEGKTINSDGYLV